MENKSEYPVWKQAINFGFVISLVLILLSLLWFIFDLSTNKTVSYLSYVVLLGGIVFSAINYRNKRNDGFITYGQSFSVGFFTGLVSAVIMSIFTYIFFKYIATDMIATMIMDAEERLIETNPDMPEEEFDLAMMYTKKFMTVGWMAIWSLLANTFFSLVFALLSSIFIKRENTGL